MNKKLKTTLQCVIVMMLWGMLFSLVKYGYTVFEIDASFTPNLLLFAGIRFLICGGVLTLFCVAKKQPLAVRTAKSKLHLLSVAVFTVVLHYGCTYTGLSMVDSGKTALLKQLGALLFICFSFLFFKEDKFSLKKLAGAALGICGIIALNTDSLHFSLGTGELLIICASFCTVIANISGKKIANELSPTVLAGESQLIGGSILTVLGLALGGKMGTVTFKGIILFTVIIVASCFGYGLWYEVVKKENLSNLFIIKFLEPIFAGVFGALILGENTWNISFLMALIFTLAAIIVSNYSPKRKAAHETK